MGLFEHFPYTNFHELNLDRIVELVKQLQKEMETLPESVKEEIEPEIVNWISEYIQDAGIDVQNGVLRILPTTPILPGGTVNGIQVGGNSYLITDPTLINVVDGIEQRTTTLEQDVQALEDAAPVGTVETFRDCRFYIDAVNGDDTDTGRQGHPFRTLDRAFDEYSKYASLWLYIIEPQEYHVTRHGVFSGHTLHITSEVDNVRIVFEDPDWLTNGIPIYNSHWNLQARTTGHVLKIKCIEKSDSSDCHLYFDNTLLSIKNVEFEDYIGFYGSSLDVEASTLNYINCENSNVTIHGGCAFTNKKPDQYAARFDNCQVNLTGTFSTDSLTAAGTTGAYLFRSTDAFVGSLIVSNQVSNYDHAIDADQGSRVVISSSRLSTIDSYCANASTTAQGASIDTYA